LDHEYLQEFDVGTIRIALTKICPIFSNVSSIDVQLSLIFVQDSRILYQCRDGKKKNEDPMFRFFSKYKKLILPCKL